MLINLTINIVKNEFLTILFLNLILFKDRSKTLRIFIKLPVF